MKIGLSWFEMKVGPKHSEKSNETDMPYLQIVKSEKKNSKR